MTRVGADHVDPSFSSNNLTIFANSFYAGADFHRSFSRSKSPWLKPTSIGICTPLSQGPIFGYFGYFWDLVVRESAPCELGHDCLRQLPRRYRTTEWLGWALGRGFSPILTRELRLGSLLLFDTRAWQSGRILSRRFDHACVFPDSL